MANSARDPYWQAGVRREIIDHPTRQGGDRGRVLDLPHADGAVRSEARRRRRARSSRTCRSRYEQAQGSARADGVSCSVCHQITTRQLGNTRELRRRLRDRHDASQSANAPDLRSVRDREGPDAIMTVSSATFKPTEGEHIRAVGTVRDLPHALHAGARARTGQVDRRAARAGALSGVAAQRLSRTTQSCQTCHMPTVEGARPDHSRAGRAARTAWRGIRSSAATSSCSGC